MDSLSTIFILSKGRPWCYTAQYLEDIAYEGDWFIWCGDNDDKLESYFERWGRDRVLVFEHAKWFDGADTLDAYGDSLGSGVFVAKNALKAVAESFGIDRYWELDDDIDCFCDIDDDELGKLLPIDDGRRLARIMREVAEYARDIGMPAFGINYCNSRTKNLRDVFQSKKKVGYGSYQVSNISVHGSPAWRGRLHEDHAFNSDCIRVGKPLFATNCFAARAAMESDYYLRETKRGGQVSEGGLRDVYDAMGGIAGNEIRRFCTALMTLPTSAGQLVFSADDVTFKTYYAKVRPKIIDDRYRCVGNKKVLFVSDRKLERAENIRAVWNRCRHQKRFVQINTKSGKYELSQAAKNGYDAVVTDEHSVPIEDKGNLKILMIGHGCTDGKQYGLDQAHPYFGEKTSEQLDCRSTTSEDTRQIAASSAGIPVEKCIALGMPRSDSYFDGSIKPVSFNGKSFYLFAPTFRIYEEGELPKYDWEAIDSLLNDNELLVVKRHMKTTRRLLEKSYRHIIEVSNAERSDKYIMGCDVLITDYSTIVVDGYLCGKPSVLFCPDKDVYMSARGMYREYPDFYSSKSCSNERELVELIRKAKEDGMGDIERNCLEVTCGACDGHSTERVLAKLDELMGV